MFLDFLLLEEKAKLGSHQITVLPETYQKQQANLGTVLGKITIPGLVSYKSVFHGFSDDAVVALDEVQL